MGSSYPLFAIILWDSLFQQKYFYFFGMCLVVFIGWSQRMSIWSVILSEWEYCEMIENHSHFRMTTGVPKKIML